MIPNRSVPQNDVIPQLAYPDVRRAAAWLCDAFGRIGAGIRWSCEPGGDADANRYRLAEPILIKSAEASESGPQGLKPTSLWDLSGPAEAVPFPKPCARSHAATRRP